ncbi:MAG: oxidoreductase [Actinomycetota bacterium]|nr:oxidoreductase [Actinomycetota bacterium]
MRHWTAADIGDRGGTVAVVTGANSGLGLHTAAALAAAGAEVILACRDPKRGTAAAHRVAAAATGPAPATVALDLADLAAVERFAQELADRVDHVDTLVNNAGVMAIPRMLTADGFEMQLGTNHLGHFALTLRLWPLLTARPGARVVTVSSGMATTARMHFDDLHGEHGYHPWGAYGQAKLANLLFAFELDRIVGHHGLGVTSVAAHPGFSATELISNGPLAGSSTRTDRAFLSVARTVVAQSAEAGALPSLYAAVDGGVQGGQYFGPRGPLHLRGLPTRVRPPRAAKRRDDARRLWEISEELTGTRLEPAA